MLKAELELGEVINDLEDLKELPESIIALEAIKKIQSLCAFDCVTDISIENLHSESHLIVQFIDRAVSEKHISPSLEQQLKQELNNALTFCEQIKEGLQNIRNRPPLKHIDSYCRSNIALAYSFVERWKDNQRAETHGSLSDFSLYTVNNKDNKDDVFDPRFGLATLKLLEQELAILETFECLDLHPSIVRKSEVHTDE